MPDNGNIKIFKPGTKDFDNLRQNTVKLAQREASDKLLDDLAKEEKHVKSTAASLEKTLALILQVVASQEERIQVLESRVA